MLPTRALRIVAVSALAGGCRPPAPSDASAITPAPAPVDRPAAAPPPSTPTTPTTPSPTPIAPRRLATGGIYNCAVHSGHVYCWGLARNHAPGEAFEMAGIDDAVEVAACYNAACARSATGRVTCWSERGQYVVDGVVASNSVAVGAEIACASVGRGVACWSPTFDGDEPPTVHGVHGVEDPIQVAAAFYHACALERGGAVKCWGKDTDGTLGTADSDEPGFDRGQANDRHWVAQAISAGDTPVDTKPFWKASESLERSLLACLGRVGTQDERHTMEFELAVDGEGVVTDVRPLRASLGPHATLAMNRCVTKAYLSDAPKLRPASGRPTKVGVKLFVQSRGGALHTAQSVAHGAVMLAANGYFTCAVLADGSLQCWGYTHGFDGPGIHGTRLESPGRPAPVDGVAGLETISIGWRHACGRRKDGTHLCFGGNADGSFGPGIPVSAEFVVRDVDAAGEYVEISAGPTLSCGRRKDGTVWCWGINDGGRLGIGHARGGVQPPAPVVGLPR